MRTNTIKYLWLSGFALLLALFVYKYGASPVSTPSHHNITKAYSEMNNIAVAMLAYFQEYGQLEHLGSVPYGVDLATSIVSKLSLSACETTVPNPYGMLFVQWRDHHGLDPWKQPYWIAWNITFRNLTNALSVLVWSSGPDGSNNMSHGNDLYVLRDLAFPACRRTLEPHPNKDSMTNEISTP